MSNQEKLPQIDNTIEGDVKNGSLEKVSGNDELVGSEMMSASDIHSGDEGREPTEHETATLRHVSEEIPWSCWLVALVELAERFSYYGLSTPFQNYMQFTPDHKPAGMLGLAHQGATALSYFFQFWCYVTPILGGWVSDTYWGKYKTICVFCGIYIVGILILFVTSIPSITSKATATGGYIASIIIIGLATGGVKSNVSPLIADQIPKKKPYIKTTKKGEQVIVDPNITVQNVVIATTELEAHVGFWAAYLLPFCFFFVAVVALALGRNVYVKIPIGDKIVNKTFKCAWTSLVNGFKFESAKPSVHPEKSFPWDDHFVEEVKRTIYACKVFIFYPVYWVVYGSMLGLLTPQGAGMTQTMPNDFLQAFDSIAIMVFIPIFERLLYPFIRRYTPFKPITKIFWGFMFGSGSMLYAAVLQHYIYKTGPCYDQPLNCENGNHINIGLQTPAYVLIAISEILASITGLEYAYTKAPVQMKSLVMAMFLLTNAFGSAIGIALSSVSVDPKMVWTFSGLCVSCFIGGLLFWFFFRHYNEREDEWNNLEYEAQLDEAILRPVTSLTSHKSLA
ncbi:PTR2 Peptide transporter PTR2 [Candida maltosa Xu316]